MRFQQVMRMKAKEKSDEVTPRTDCLSGLRIECVVPRFLMTRREGRK